MIALWEAKAVSSGEKVGGRGSKKVSDCISKAAKDSKAIARCVES